MSVETGESPYEILARAARTLAAGLGLLEALELIATAAYEATGADLAVVRVRDPAASSFVVRAAAPADSPLAAELVGSRVPLEELEARLAAGEDSLVAAFAGERL